MDHVLVYRESILAAVASEEKTRVLGFPSRSSSTASYADTLSGSFHLSECPFNKWLVDSIHNRDDTAILDVIFCHVIETFGCTAAQRN
jgi:hypothetical protein